MGDGVQMPPDAPANVGLEQIRSFVGGLLESLHVLEFDIVTEDLGVSGNLAFARGTFNWLAEPAGGGDQFFSDGKFLTIFQKQPDGIWKIYRNTFNSNIPAEAVYALP